MATRFPSITYSELTSYIANKIYNELVCNIGNSYNQLPTYHTKTIYQRNRILNASDMKNAKNVTAVWNVELEGDTYYDRKIYDHSQGSSDTIKYQLDTYLLNNGVQNINSEIKQGSFLALVHNLVTFISNRIVIHTSQERYDIASTPAAEKKGLPTSDLTPSTGVGITSDGKYTCYDSYITDPDLIKNDTKMPGESGVVSIPSENIDYKIVDHNDIKRIIDSLTRLIKKPYRFSGTYYSFNLLSGDPNKPIELVVRYFGAGSESVTPVFSPKSSWKDGSDKKTNYSITTAVQTENYMFVGWEKCTITFGDDDKPIYNKSGAYNDNEAAISTTEDKSTLTLKSDYLWNNGNLNVNAWTVACVFKEKPANKTTFKLTTDEVDKNDNSIWTIDTNSNKISYNMIGEKSVRYTGCTVTKDTSNDNPITYTISTLIDDFFGIDGNGYVTCEREEITPFTGTRTATVLISQKSDPDVKSYSGSYTLEIISKYMSLTSSLFEFTAPSVLTGGKPASFKAKVTGIGTSRTIEYSNDYEDTANPGTWSEDIPKATTKATLWYCRLTCKDQGTKYLAGTVFDPAWKFTITKT